MSVPEGIPEDRRKSFYCPNCGTGNIVEVGGVWQCDGCGWTPGISAVPVGACPKGDENIEDMLRRIMVADKTPEYGYSSSDPQTYVNRAGHSPPVGARWMTPRDICKEYLRGNYEA